MGKPTIDFIWPKRPHIKNNMAAFMSTGMDFKEQLQLQFPIKRIVIHNM